MHALTRLAASAWGCTVPRAREIYTKVIRSCIAYGAGAFYNPGKPRFAKAMARHQAQALRTVLGAYKATPIRSLELDGFCPPLDIHLNKWVADFELRMQLSGLSLQLDRATAYVEARLRDRRKQLEGTHWEWAKNWTGSTGHPDDCWDSKAAAARDWEARWTAQARTAPARADNSPAAKVFEGGHIRLYEKLAKAEGSMLCQARTEKIGIQRFLFFLEILYNTSDDRYPTWIDVGLANDPTFCDAVILGNPLFINYVYVFMLRNIMTTLLVVLPGTVTTRLTPFGGITTSPPRIGRFLAGQMFRSISVVLSQAQVNNCPRPPPPRPTLNSCTSKS